MLSQARFYVAIRKNENEFMTYLMVDATRHEAVRPYLRDSIKAAVNPSVATMATMGIVSLPGMMTGQILSGTEPLIAVKYQIAIMSVITGSVALSTFLILRLGYRSYFTSHQSLRDD